MIKIEASSFGSTKNGEKVMKYTLKNDNDFEFSVISYGATLQAIYMNDKNGKINNLALGFDTVEGKLR
jgi:aldose 1-epimerase